MRRLILGSAFCLVASGCFLGPSSLGPAEELRSLATQGTKLAYAATYRFVQEGPLAPGQATVMEIVQDPPSSLRKLETTTSDVSDETVTVRSWQARSVDGDFSCGEYGEDGIRCLPNPLAAGTFGTRYIDEFFDEALDPAAFATVERTNRSARVADEVGTCFEAVPAIEGTGEPDASSTPDAAFVSERSRLELCYTEDGILLRGRRTVIGVDGGASGVESLVELVSLSRVVEPRELNLPGPVADASDLR